MTVQEFRDTLTDARPPAGLGPLLQALWHDANGGWEAAHELIQDDQSEDAAWVHAYLHRKEGDRENAAYWYGRAGQSVPGESLDVEWGSLVQTFLDRS